MVPLDPRSTRSATGIAWRGSRAKICENVVVRTKLYILANARWRPHDLPSRSPVTRGCHFIDMYPGIYQGEEKRPANYKMPQLTALDDHPGERLPIFRWAFLITAP